MQRWIIRHWLFFTRDNRNLFRCLSYRVRFKNGAKNNCRPVLNSRVNSASFSFRYIFRVCHVRQADSEATNQSRRCKPRKCTCWCNPNNPLRFRSGLVLFREFEPSLLARLSDKVPTDDAELTVAQSIMRTFRRHYCKLPVCTAVLSLRAGHAEFHNRACCTHTRIYMYVYVYTYIDYGQTNALRVSRECVSIEFVCLCRQMCRKYKQSCARRVEKRNV